MVAVMEAVDMVQLLEATVSILLVAVYISNNLVCQCSITHIRNPKQFCIFVCLQIDLRKMLINDAELVLRYVGL